MVGKRVNEQLLSPPEDVSIASHSVSQNDPEENYPGWELKRTFLRNGMAGRRNFDWLLKTAQFLIQQTYPGDSY